MEAGLPPENHPRRTGARLVEYDPRRREANVLAAALYRFGRTSYHQARQAVRAGQADALAEALLGRLGRFDTPLRELEHTTYTFDALVDSRGACAGVQASPHDDANPAAADRRAGVRHPRRIVEARPGARPIAGAMEAAAELWQKLDAFHPLVAQYIVPNGFNRRVLATFNLREAPTPSRQLRAAPNAHFSIRRLAQRVAEEIRRVHPRLAKFMRLPEEAWQDIEKGYFA